jgi:hypothetical protein
MTKKSEVEKAPADVIVNGSSELGPVKKDLIRTTITIIVFVVIIAAIYLIQTKTQALRPVLKLFGL